MHKIYFLITAAIVVILIISLFYFYKKEKISNNFPESKKTQPIQVGSDIQIKEKYIISKECSANGGKIIQVDPEKKECPDKKIFLGMVKDVNCICACCK